MYSKGSELAARVTFSSQSKSSPKPFTQLKGVFQKKAECDKFGYKQKQKSWNEISKNHTRNISHLMRVMAKFCLDHVLIPSMLFRSLVFY